MRAAARHMVTTKLWKNSIFNFSPTCGSHKSVKIATCDRTQSHRTVASRDSDRLAAATSGRKGSNLGATRGCRKSADSDKITRKIDLPQSEEEEKKKEGKKKKNDQNEWPFAVSGRRW